MQARFVTSSFLIALLGAGTAHADRWSEGTPRWFVSTKSDIGFAYLRPRVSGGYGQPHHFWLGVDANPIVSSSATGAYSGVHFEHPHVELRAGALYFYAFRRSFLPLQDSYDRRDVELIVKGERATYVAWSTELELNLPVGFGEIHSESEPIRVASRRSGRATYLESLPAVIHGAWAYRQQLGYSFPVNPVNGLSLGAVAETIWIPERDAVIWRGGTTVRWWLYDNLQLRLTFIPVISSPDRLGLKGGDFGEIGIRHYWATGARRDRQDESRR